MAGVGVKLTAMFDQGNNYDRLVSECKANGTLWEDPLFLPIDSSLFYSRKPPRPFEWKRPSELVADPQLFVEGASRFDVEQGMLGDCWFLAALAGLSLDPHLLYVVLPREQNFDQGIIKFNFWQYGIWRTVVVDDLLPTYNGKLVFVHSKEKNEFWSALLEKAYAKINGGYESLKGGQMIEAMEDFTGGMSECVDLQKHSHPNLFEFLKSCYDMDAQLGCSIAAKPNQIEAKGAEGLVRGHAYTITDLKKISLDNKEVELIRIRNPWGNEREWTGAWSDKSREWDRISEDERQTLGLVKSDDGEFWMSIDDFTRNFSTAEICHLSGQQRISTDKKKKWESSLQTGSWRKGLSAGGCRNFIDTFHMNPQYALTLKEADEDDADNATCLVALMQKSRRAQRKIGAQNLTIGFSIYKCDGKFDQSATLTKEYFMYNQSTARSPTFINGREVVGRFKLPLGQYFIIPSTFNANEEGDFVLRIYTTKQSDTVAVNEESGMIDVSKQPPRQDDDQTARFRAFFEKLSGADMEIDAWELQQILDAAFKKEGCAISVESCKSLIALTDEDQSGKLAFEEFQELWQNIRAWRVVFEKHDSDNSGVLSAYEMRSALRSIGFTLSNKTSNFLVLRYGNKNGEVTLDSFIAAASKLKLMFTSFASKSRDGSALFGLDEFLALNLSS